MSKLKVRGVSLARAAAFLVVVCLAAVSQARTKHTWKTTSMAANTPATAYKWSDATNWTTETVPAPYDEVEFPAPSNIYYVELPEDGATIYSFSNKTGNGNYMCLLGGTLTIGADDNTIAKFDYGAGVLFAELATGTSVDTKFPYVSNMQLAGRAVAAYQHFTPAGGWVRHRLDKFATSSNPVRTDDLAFSPRYHNPGSASVAVYAPQGSEACSGEWTLTEGSPYASRTAAADHALSAGTVVSCDGALPSGTYLKRIFSTTLIELSESATASGAMTLSFAAFTPDVRITNQFNRLGDTPNYFSLYKYRPEDSLVYDITACNGNSAQTMHWGITASEAESWYPGRYVFHNMNDNGSRLILMNSEIELAGTSSGGPTTFKDAVRVEVQAGCTATIIVTNNLSGVINTMTNLSGTLVKDGAGTLTANIATAENSGSISVKAGTLVLGAKAALGDTVPAIGNLSVSAGAELQLPSNGLKAASMALEEGAVLRGPGMLHATDLSDAMEGVVLEDGAKIVYDVGKTGALLETLPEGEVVGHPMFWLDASKSDSIVYTEENGTNFVTRWNDCRAGEEMFCTNIYYRPQFINGDTMTNKYVRLGRHNTSTNALTECLVWSKPVGGIKAIFLVQDPTEGGGQICGRTSDVLPNKYYGSQGGPFYRGGSSDYGKNIIAASYATPCVKYGRYYLNGTEVCGYETGYLGAYMQLVECHVNTNYYASPNNGIRDLWLNAFGVDYLDKSQYGKGCNGCMRIAEYIIYTNSLTHVERVKVAQYLSRKWLGKNVVWTAADMKTASGDVTANGQIVDVEAGLGHAIMSLGGDGELTKTGDGELYLGSVTDARVTVKGGSLIVRSLATTNSFVPEGAWVHVDAADPASAETYESAGVSYISKWRNLAGDGGWYNAYATDQSDAFYVTNAMNGLPYVDMGPLYWSGDKTPTKRALRYTKSDGTRYSKLNAYPWLMAPALRTIFISADTSQGGISLIGADNNGYPAVGLPHQGTNTATAIISASDHKWGYTDFTTCFRNGTALFRTNGVPVNASEVPFSYGQDVFVYRSNSRVVRGDALGIYGYANSANGIAYGEVLLYEDAMETNAMNAVEAYMRTKWRGETVPGFAVAQMDSLVFENGASAHLCGYGLSDANPIGSLTVGELGGEGTLTGEKVALSAGGALVAMVDSEGAVSALTVNGNLDLSKGGSVTFAGDVLKLEPGYYPLVSATALEFGGEWTCASPLSNRTATLRRQGSTLYLNVSACGTMIILR